MEPAKATQAPEVGVQYCDLESMNGTCMAALN
jgi:hypothetical protein